MISVRKSEDRGQYRNYWLDSRHSFSFGEYYDPQHLGFSALRVINEDWVKAGAGFPTHGHRDMEIITYILEGALEHKDSLGTGSIIRPGEVQRMSAGTGVSHSEFNPQADTDTRLLQIWLLPEKRGIEPSYEQITVPPEARRGKLKLIGARDGRDGAVTIHQDASLYASLLGAGETAELALADRRTAWVQVANGAITVNGIALKAGDGAAIKHEAALKFAGVEDSEFLVFDLPPLQN
ncbi:MAG: pirin family protein [Rhodospirillaceae bacterium]|nr:pirin family protein [Rhodospirillaceae bacterium]